MKQKLLTDIELDVHELKCLMESFSKEPNQTLSELLKRSIARMQGRLDELSQEIGSVVVSDVPSSIIEETIVEEKEIVVSEEQSPVVIQSPQPVISEEAPVVIKKEEPKSSVLGESIKLAAGLRHSISLNDSFRFSRELFKGDTDLMNRVIEQISVMGSYKTAVAFLSSKVEIDEEKEAVVDFLELLKKYFNQSA
ncbi:hypothetical protein [uncultured Bacteroides sp.]|uniref:hypothetical protein n=1 Tax=uncultured Bacteroides sp. TaxID=162156 RepID=UPI00280B3338|nr:hypothetical protein [uncultured Bacteroides sp.]